MAVRGLWSLLARLELWFWLACLVLVLVAALAGLVAIFVAGWWVFVHAA